MRAHLPTVLPTILSLLAGLGLCGLPGCYVLKSPRNPMPTVRHEARSSEATGLIVLLPGFADGPDHFDEYGLIAAAREAAPDFDIVATDAHFGYYRKFSIVDRLHEDVIAPLADQYDQVWLVGISMGGLGAVSYAMEHEEIVDGIVLLAPFMGSERVVSEVERAGGLASWHPSDPNEIEDVRERHYDRVWSWYQGYTRPDGSRPELYLGYGDEDSLARANRLVAQVLPADHTRVASGGHKWKVWTPLFASLMQTAVANRAEHTPSEVSAMLAR